MWAVAFAIRISSKTAVKKNASGRRIVVLPIRKMRCPNCRSILNADTESSTQEYECVNCRIRWAVRFDWRVFVIGLFVGAPILNGLIQLLLETAGSRLLGDWAASKDGVILISFVLTTLALLAAYAYLRRPIVREPPTPR
jgi:hypothetical protein